MKVLYIVGGEGNRYGSEIIAIDLISSGKEYGIDYTVIAAKKGAVTEACEKLGVKCYVFPFTFFVYKAMNNELLNMIKKTIWRCRAEFLTYNAVKKIEKEIDLSKIDLIHTNLSRDLLGGIIAEKHGIPHVWHIQELFQSHYQLTFLRNKQVEWMKDHANRFAVISKTVAREWTDNGLPENKVSIVYNGVDLNSIEKKQDYDSTNPIIKIVIVGHIVPAKGQADVINKLSKLPESIRNNVFLDCIGEGTEEYKNNLQKMAKEAAVNLRLRGYCSQIGNVLKEYDIGVNCSRGEGFGLSTVEYMVAGICPVVANTGANEEIIQDKKNGYVFNYSDDKSFAEIIQKLYNNKEEMICVSQNARNDALERFSVEKMRAQMFSLYSEICG